MRKAAALSGAFCRMAQPIRRRDIDGGARDGRSGVDRLASQIRAAGRQH
jgi:hypothetical protein